MAPLPLAQTRRRAHQDRRIAPARGDINHSMVCARHFGRGHRVPSPNGSPNVADALFVASVSAPSSAKSWAWRWCSPRRPPRNCSAATCRIMARLVMDVWGSGTMRAGGEDLALALLLMGARPACDQGSARVSGIEILPIAGTRSSARRRHLAHLGPVPRRLRGADRFERPSPEPIRQAAS